MTQELLGLSASRLARGISKREFSAEDVVRSAIHRIEAVQSCFNAFTEVLAEESLASARRIDRQKGGSEAGILVGVPVTIKDFTPSMGHLTTLGSKVFAGRRSTHDALIVQRLKAAGAIIVAKTTTPEFAFSSFTRSPLWGETRNPWDPTRNPGGSSGGAAVSVVTGAVPLAEGTDMGGSVRIPAALSGCIGLKPSKGRIPMEITPTVFDHIAHFGPLARTTEDVALFLRATEGPDPCDIQSQRSPLPIPPFLDPDLRGLRIAASADLGMYAVEDVVARNLQETVRVLSEAGAKVDWVDLKWPASYATDWFDYWCVYLAAQHGHLLQTDRDLLDPDLAATLEAGQRIEAVRIERGAQARTRQWLDMARLFERYDALICPTMAKVAPRHTARDSDFEAMTPDGRIDGLDMTAVFNNVSVCPAISIPNWTVDDRLPTAVQVVGNRFDDPTVLRVAACLEKLAPWPIWPG